MSNDFIKDKMGARKEGPLVSIRKRSLPDGSEQGSAFGNQQKMNRNHSMSQMRMANIQSRAN